MSNTDTSTSTRSFLLNDDNWKPLLNTKKVRSIDEVEAEQLKHSLAKPLKAQLRQLHDQVAKLERELRWLEQGSCELPVRYMVSTAPCERHEYRTPLAAQWHLDDRQTWK